MTVIYDTKNFKLESVEKTFIDRLEGAHVRVSQKTKPKEDKKLSPKMKAELNDFIAFVSKALKTGRKKRGIEIGRIDSQENKDKKSGLPVQLYCRDRFSTMQKYSEPVTPSHKKEYKPLDVEDIRAISKEIKKLLKKEKDSLERENGKLNFQGNFNKGSKGVYRQPAARQEHRQQA